jgi:hypothetical protein
MEITMIRVICPVAVIFVIANSISASEETIGPKGINSAATGLNGMDILIGQVEGGRPGRAGPPNNDTEQVNAAL